MKAADEAREKELLNWGNRIVRFTNQEVGEQMENVLKKKFRYSKFN
ncbi:MAG: DUF559 domain-containing protein [Ferruginibacter sp.]|nr:DUF559 domain-containing protein [Chitinophagaceae bacterium]